MASAPVRSMTHTVDTEADTTCGRHTDLKGIQEVFVGVVCLLITCCESLLLCCETRSLVDGIVQLGVSVGHLPAVHEELETLYIVRVLRFLLGQRGDLHRMIHDEGRLQIRCSSTYSSKNRFRISPFLCLSSKAMLCSFASSLACSRVSDLVPVNVCIFLHSVYHGQALKGLAQIHLDAFVYGICVVPRTFCAT